MTWAMHGSGGPDPIWIPAADSKSFYLNLGSVGYAFGDSGDGWQTVDLDAQGLSSVATDQGVGPGFGVPWVLIPPSPGFYIWGARGEASIQLAPVVPT